ncbi:MAG: DUF5777 family beta-barrel protein [candidate division KSB1 bacterium]|nr:DUF5777 family beta-barrel protein [candidate division KSB1 bacterium]
MLQLFHSLNALVLPSAETPSRGDILFKVSHRFRPPVGDGIKAFWGLDGPANIRLALGYAITDRIFVNVGRTNVYDNADLQLRYKAWTWDNDLLPVVLTFQGGAAWNSQLDQPVR